MSRVKQASTPRAVALTALCRVEKGAYANLVLSELFEQTELPARDRAFATELVYGTLRWRGKVDWVLGHFVKRSLASQHPIIRNLLRMSVYQLLFLPNIPDPVVGNEAVQLAKGEPAARHATSFVNAVIRKVAARGRSLAEPSYEKDPVLALSVTTSHPEWMIRRWIGQYGAEFVKDFLRANNEPAPLCARVNTLRTDVTSLIALLEAQGIQAAPSQLLPTGIRIEGAPGIGNIPAFQAGLFTAQDEGSQLIGYAVDPQPGDVVYDVCSAPGTKSTHMAELMGDKGRIIASDVHPGRLRLVEEGCKRLGIGSVTALVADARSPKGQPGSADRVLIDAPCSGVGVLRRRPDLRWHRREEDFDDLVKLQQDILLGTSTLVRPGGILVYSTCSVDYEENQRNIAWFLAKRPDFRPDSLIPVLPQALVEGLDPERRRRAELGQLQLWPHLDGTDGFFIARLLREN